MQQMLNKNNEGCESISTLCSDLRQIYTQMKKCPSKIKTRKSQKNNDKSYKLYQN